MYRWYGCLFFGEAADLSIKSINSIKKSAYSVATYMKINVKILSKDPIPRSAHHVRMGYSVHLTTSQPPTHPHIASKPSLLSPANFLHSGFSRPSGCTSRTFEHNGGLNQPSCSPSPRSVPPPAIGGILPVINKRRETGLISKNKITLSAKMIEIYTVPHKSEVI